VLHPKMPPAARGWTISLPIFFRYLRLAPGTGLPLARPAVPKPIEGCCHFQFLIFIAEDRAVSHFSKPTTLIAKGRGLLP
jgi:hypothetical protein